MSGSITNADREELLRLQTAAEELRRLLCQAESLAGRLVGQAPAVAGFLRVDVEELERPLIALCRDIADALV
jgi:hypothetical protein